jgi:hypothetical protein
MARGQYDLPINRARPTYGPSRPPPPEAIRPARTPSNDGLLSQQTRPVVLVFSASGTAIPRSQLVALRARVAPDAAIQVINTADAGIAALARKPSAVIVLDNATSQPSFELARSEVLRYAQNGGCLITDLSQLNSATQYDTMRGNDRRVEYSVKDHLPDLRADHLMS